MGIHKTTVLDVLDMYLAFHNSYESLNENEKLMLNKYDLRFNGFDAKNEGGAFDYLKEVLADPREYELIFQNRRSKDFDTHKRMSETYSRGITKWKKIQKKEKLSFEEMKLIIDAMK